MSGYSPVDRAQFARDARDAAKFQKGDRFFVEHYYGTGQKTIVHGTVNFIKPIYGNNNHAYNVTYEKGSILEDEHIAIESHMKKVDANP